MSKFQNKDAIKKLVQAYEHRLYSLKDLHKNTAKSNLALLAKEIEGFQKVLEPFQKNYEALKEHCKLKGSIPLESQKANAECQKFVDIMTDLEKKKSALNKELQEAV